MARSGHLAAASFVASAAILCAAARLGLLDGVPAVRVAFFALLPTVLAANVVAERAGFVLFEAAWELLVRLVDPRAALAKRDDADAALREARAELFKAFSERLPPTYSASSLRRVGTLDPRRTSAMTSEVMSSATTNKSLYEQVRENLVDHVFRSILSGGSAAADAPLYFMDPTTGSFLKVNHQRKLVFTRTPDASCLFHIVKGKTHHWGFHSAIHQRYIGQNFVGRIVLTSKKLNAWEAFRVLQRRDDEGGNASDEANNGANGDASQHKITGTKASPQIYLILCSARFGKGMWLAKNRRVANHGVPGSSQSGSHKSHRSSLTETGSQPLSASGSNISFSSSHGPAGPDRHSAVYLSKNFANALSLVYSPDLSAFDRMAHVEATEAEGISSSSSSPPPGSTMTKSMSLPSWRLRQQLLRSSSHIPIAQGTAFQPPVLVKRERAAVHLPWILDERSSSFFELDEANLTDVLETVVDNCDLADLLEAVLPAASREMYRAQAAAAAAAALDRSWTSVPSFSSSASTQATSVAASSEAKRDAREGSGVIHSSVPPAASASASPSASPSKPALPLSEWHAHPHFGFVRKLTYRPPSASDEGVDTALSMISRGRAGATSVRSISIDQFNSLAVDNEVAPRKLTFRTKLYTLSIPYSNCFSIETLVEFEASSQETQIVPVAGGATPAASQGSISVPAIKLRVRTGVFFSRETMFAPQIRRGALEGITSTSQALIELLKEMSIDRKSAAMSLPASSASSSRSASISTDSTFISRIFAMEIVKALVSSICDAKSLPETLSTLPIQLPWKVFTTPTSSSGGFKFERSKTSKGPAFVAAPSSALSPQMPAVTAALFFESAPEQFSRVLEESLGTTVTPRLFFDALLSDECAFFRSSRGPRQSGNMDVDVGAWGVLPKQRPNSSGSSSSSTISLGSSRHVRNVVPASEAFVRKQVFRMPLSGVPGIEVAQLEDYQYYAFVDRHGPESRLEFGMKLYAPSLPDGDNSSTEVLVVVEKDDKPPGHVLRVYFAVPTWDPAAKRAAVANPHLIAGVLRGLKAIWKHVARTMTHAATHARSHTDAGEDLDAVEVGQLKLKLWADGELPTHDELASQLVEAVASAYS